MKKLLAVSLISFIAAPVFAEDLYSQLKLVDPLMQNVLNLTQEAPKKVSISYDSPFALYNIAFERFKNSNTKPAYDDFKNLFENAGANDYFYMKSLLYPQCVRWAIERITAEEMAALTETFSFMEFYTATEDLEKMKKINHGFDAIVYNASHNTELERTLLRYDFLIRYANKDISYPLNYLPTVLEEHRAIYEAFKANNPEAGAEAAQIHAFKSMLRRK